MNNDLVRNQAEPLYQIRSARIGQRTASIPSPISENAWNSMGNRRSLVSYGPSLVVVAGKSRSSDRKWAWWLTWFVHSSMLYESEGHVAPQAERRKRVRYSQPEFAPSDFGFQAQIPPRQRRHYEPEASKLKTLPIQKRSDERQHHQRRQASMEGLALSQTPTEWNISRYLPSITSLVERFSQFFWYIQPRIHLPTSISLQVHILYDHRRNSIPVFRYNCISFLVMASGLRFISES